MKIQLTGLMVVLLLFAVAHPAFGQVDRVKELEDSLKTVQSSIRTALDNGNQAEAIILNQRALMIARSLIAIKKSPARNAIKTPTTSQDRSEDVYVLIRSIMTLNKLLEKETASEVSAVCKRIAESDDIDAALKRISSEHQRDDSNKDTSISQSTGTSAQATQSNPSVATQAKTKEHLQNEVTVFKKAMEALLDSTNPADHQKAPVLAKAMKQRTSVIYSDSEMIEWTIDPNETSNQIALLKRAAELMRNNSRSLQASFVWELVESLKAEIASQSNRQIDEAEGGAVADNKSKLYSQLAEKLDENAKIRMMQRIEIRRLRSENDKLRADLKLARENKKTNQ